MFAAIYLEFFLSFWALLVVHGALISKVTTMLYIFLENSLQMLEKYKYVHP